MSDEIYNISQYMHDAVVRLKNAAPEPEENTFPTFHLRIMYDVGANTEYGRKPQLTIWMQGGPPEDFPIIVDDPNPFTNWQGYCQEVIKGFRAFCRNASVDFKVNYLEDNSGK